MNHFESVHRNQSSQPASLPSVRSDYRGLPSPVALEELVRTLLTEQHRYWPELVGTAALPIIDGESIAKLATEFESANRSHQVATFVRHLIEGKFESIGAAHVRYSDKNSNTRSLDQQLIDVLRVARRENTFIPWSFVFADAAIMGRTTARNGHQLLRQFVQSGQRFERLIADDLDRLIQDQIESLTFSKFLEQHGTRLTTVSGYDSVDQSAKLTHSFKAMQNEFFIDQLKDKVDRGMTDAFKRSKSVGTPPTGYKRQPVLDASGKPIINRKGKCEMNIVIDDEAADVVRRIFEMYTESKMSPQQIAMQFNDEQVLGKKHWCTAAIRQILRNEHYIGRLNWKKTRTVTNSRTGKKAAVPRRVGTPLARRPGVANHQR